MKAFRFVAALLAAGPLVAPALAEGPKERRLSREEYRDKMKGGWIGQMAGVGVGAPTEFRWQGAIVPADQVPAWTPETINQFDQDDIYVEMTFLRTLQTHGLDASTRQAGIDFANSKYPLWHANKEGRSRLREGIAPPDSGHPAFNDHADDIDYQIEADFSGLIAPGLPNTVIRLGEVFGRLRSEGVTDIAAFLDAHADEFGLFDHGHHHHRAPRALDTEGRKGEGAIAFFGFVDDDEEFALVFGIVHGALRGGVSG